MCTCRQCLAWEMHHMSTQTLKLLFEFRAHTKDLRIVLEEGIKALECTQTESGFSLCNHQQALFGYQSVEGLPICAHAIRLSQETRPSRCQVIRGQSRVFYTSMLRKTSFVNSETLFEQSRKAACPACKKHLMLLN